jgi:hypothetical protein
VLSDAKLSGQEKLSAILEVQKALLPSPASSDSTTGAQRPIVKDTQGSVNIQYGWPPGSAPK